MYEDQIIFTFTATNRPKILERSLESFKKNLIDFDLKKTYAIINLDPAPNKNNIEKNLEIIDKYFIGGKYRIPEEPNFTSAVNWVWKAAETPYIFHHETDWELLNPVKMSKIIKYINRDSCIKQCILRAYNYKYEKMPLSPSLIKKDLYKKIAGNLNEKINPEIQLRDPEVVGFEISAKNLVVYGKSPIVKDIGRKWAKKNNIKKPDKKANFVKWEL